MQKYRYWKGEKITSMTGSNIFVFGSNPEGRHGAGAAKDAQRFGAKRYKGRGLSGNTYALITKNLTAGFHEKETGITYEKEGFGSVSIEMISANIDELYKLAKSRPDLTFFVVYKNEKWDSGHGKKSLNGYRPIEIISLFVNGKDVPENIRFHNSFKESLEKTYSCELSY